MITKITRHLLSPFSTFKKILYKIQSLVLIPFYKQKKYENQQNEIFAKLGLDREKAILKSNEIKRNFEFINKPMLSEHQTLFAALSLKKQSSRILEIGTFDGTNAFYLSKLFPESKILTIDLDENDTEFKKFYNRNDNSKLKAFCEERDKILGLSENIIFKKLDSMNLIFSDEKYDLIWIDGAHGYPFVTIDIVNSIRMLNNNGLILCDDVWKDKPLNQDSMYNSIATFETLEKLKKSKIIEYDLIFKRLDKKNNCNSNLRKYIAVVKKIISE